MKDIRQSLPVKAAAVLLLTVLTAAAAVMAVGTAASYDTDLGRNANFYDSEICANMTWNAMSRAYDVYANGYYYHHLGEYGTNFGYEIYRLPPEEAGPDSGLDQIPDQGLDHPGQAPDVLLTEVAGENAGTPETPEVGLVSSYNIPDRVGYQAEETWGDLRIVGYVAAPLRPGDNFYLYSQLNALLVQSGGSSLGALLVLLALICVVLVYLLCAAGHRPGRAGVAANALDRVPLDLYLAAAAGGTTLLTAALGDMLFYGWGLSRTLSLLGLFVVFYTVALTTLLTLTTRFKLGRWWRNTVLYKTSVWAIRLLRRMGRTVRDTVRLLPYSWRTVLAVAGMLLLQFFLTTCMWTALSLQGFWFLCIFFMDAAVLMGVVYFVWQMRRIFWGGEALAAGDLDKKVSTDHMFWDFKRHAENLNAIGEGMERAVEQRLQSERLKTELITNVSHDIKTPLTSIVNYVDLLKKEDLGETAAGYVEVLDRQSRRLKKLTEDLVEASKASTGNIAVDLQKTVVNEVVHQAVGEYAERLTAGKLEVVVSTMQGSVLAYADGRLLWRVLDNLLSNVSKYALPGTRVYIDLKEEPERVRLTVKNISRDPLNIDSSELTERFVRGDASRNTEGSGLGLNIAKSLIELMRGEFWLEVDGDLFKAEIALPRAWERNTLEAIAPPPPGFGVFPEDL